MNSVWVVAALLAFWFIWQRKSKTQAGALPPGPTPVPILGNVRDLTAKELWLTATKWAKEFGKAASPFYVNRAGAYVRQRRCCTRPCSRAGPCLRESRSPTVSS